MFRGSRCGSKTSRSLIRLASDILDTPSHTLSWGVFVDAAFIADTQTKKRLLEGAVNAR